ncbi:MAG TPA: hypothetical protein VIU61_28150 [Kofleriaceae bacterium]
MLSRCLVVGVLASVVGCTPPEPPKAPIPPVSTGKVRVRVFTEPSPVRRIAVAGRFIFVGTDRDLERWDDGGGVLALSAKHGLSGNQIVALATDVDRRWVWILTEGGLGHYDAAREVYEQLPQPPATIGVDWAVLAKEGATVAAASDGGAWLGTARGLVYASPKGGWATTAIKEPIQGLARDRSGWLWVATKSGLIARKPSGETIRIGTGEGFGVVDPRIMVEMPGDRMLVIGADDTGRDRIAFGKHLQWQTYRALPEVKWDAAARRGAGAVVMAGDRVYRIALHDKTRVRPLARDGMRLVPVGSGRASEWVIEPVDLVVPPGAMSLGSLDDQLLIGTRDLGTALYRDGDVRPRDWLRRREMFHDATHLSVACSKRDDCWIATGAQQAWHWANDRFEPGGPEQIVLAVIRDPAGPLYALYRGGGEALIRLARIDGTPAWNPLPKVQLSTPGPDPEISFARFASSGSLWVGLRYRDGIEMRPWGIAIIDLAAGKVAYHRTADVATKPDPKKAPLERMLPIPVGVVDADVRGDTAWFATNEGVARLADGKVELWTEADGLRSELARAVAFASDGGVIVATGAGAARWDGKTWSFPAALRFEINDLVATRNGQVWMATERGIAAWDGQKVRRVDTRRGLAENSIIDVAADQFDRVWARGPGSLTLISQ